MILLTAVAAWILALMLVAGLCVAARRGDRAELEDRAGPPTAPPGPPAGLGGDGSRSGPVAVIARRRRAAARDGRRRPDRACRRRERTRGDRPRAARQRDRAGERPGADAADRGQLPAV